MLRIDTAVWQTIISIHVVACRWKRYPCLQNCGTRCESTKAREHFAKCLKSSYALHD